MLNKIIIFFLSLGLLACSQTKKHISNAPKFNATKEDLNIRNMLDSLNNAASKADFQKYFNFYADDAVFAGTDATERWNKTEFMSYAKPHFDKGKAWTFTSIQRAINFNKTGDMAWFDELLSTQMKICRGSGVLIKEGERWVIKQYILSATIPNPIMNDVVKMKALAEESLILKLLKKE